MHRLYDSEASPKFHPHAVIKDLPSGPYKTALSFSGQMVATLHENTLLEIRNIDTPSLTMSVRNEAFMKYSDVAWRPQYNDVVTSTYDLCTRIWDVGSKTVRSMWKTKKLVDHIAVHPEGNLVATATYDNEIQILDTRIKTVVHYLVSPYSFISSVDFSPSGNRMLCSSFYGGIVIWDLRTNDPSCSFRVKESSCSVPYAKFVKEKFIVTSEVNVLKKWDIDLCAMGFLPKVYKGHYSVANNSTSTFAVAGDKYLLMGSDTGDIHVWDLIDGQVLQIFAAHRDAVLQTVAVPFHNVVVTTSTDNDKQLKVWKREVV